MLPRINKLITDQASVISNEINKHIIHRLTDFSTMDECSKWFMSSEGQQVMDRCIYMGLGIEPKRPRRKMAYTFFSKDRKPPSLQEGRAMWKALDAEEKQMYEQQADEAYQQAIRQFTDIYNDLESPPQPQRPRAKKVMVKDKKNQGDTKEMEKGDTGDTVKQPRKQKKKQNQVLVPPHVVDDTLTDVVLDDDI